MREGWTYKKFEDCLVKAPKAKQVQTSQYNTGTKYPIVSQEDTLISGYFDDDAYLYHIDNPIVVFGDHTRVLKYIDFDFVVGADGVKILIPKEFLNAKLLYYYLLWYKIPNLGYSRHYKLLKEINIPVPSLSEQQSIVAELDKINELISLKKAQLSDLDALAQSIFYDMFGDPIENEKGWEVKKLGEICNIGTGATPSRIQENRYFGGNIPWVKTTEVCYQDIYDTEEKITPLAIEETNCKLYPEGTLLMAMYGQGKTRGQVAKLMVPAATNQACAAIIVNVEKLCIDYLYMLLIIQYDNIRAMAQGGNQANLNMKLVGSIPLPLPPLSLQQEFAKRIELIEQQKAKISSTIKALETLLASRMQYWFD